MATYYLKYHTGAGDEIITGTLEEAMKDADEGAEYTQQDITIEDESGKVAALRQWYGVEYDPDETEEEDVITFGDFGYYGEWQFYPYR